MCEFMHECEFLRYDLCETELVYCDAESEAGATY